MAFITLHTEKTGSTFVISINRVAVLNALNLKLLEELDQAIQAFDMDKSAKGAIITGSGSKAFAAGADIAEIGGIADKENALKVSLKGQALFDRIEKNTKPIIAAVNGFALGGGCELAMACHLRFASENARFGQPEVKLGIIAGYGGTQRLPRLIGRSRATELLLTGEMIDAEEAKRLGLVNQVFPQAELMAKCLEILEKIYLNSSSAVALTLRAINSGVMNPEKGARHEAHYFSIAVQSRDGKEGTKAFLEKRKANFSGRLTADELKEPDEEGEKKSPDTPSQIKSNATEKTARIEPEIKIPITPAVEKIEAGPETSQASRQYVPREEFISTGQDLTKSQKELYNIIDEVSQPENIEAEILNDMVIEITEIPSEVVSISIEIIETESEAVEVILEIIEEETENEEITENETEYQAAFSETEDEDKEEEGTEEEDQGAEENEETDKEEKLSPTLSEILFPSKEKKKKKKDKKGKKKNKKH